jgi:hypothetical protein
MNPRARLAAGGTVIFWCPGCNSHHGVATDPNNPNSMTGAKWSWNGSLERPTFSPSILVHPHETVPVEIPEGLSGEALTRFLDANRVTTPRCHSFVRDGRIEFCSDSGHSLSGQTVDLPEVDQ